jgi:hypothetical protein
MRVRRRRKIRVGDIYEDCAYHPVLCLESQGDDIAGISLLDYSEPRSCSIKHCGVFVMTPEQVAESLRDKERILAIDPFEGLARSELPQIESP